MFRGKFILVRHGDDKMIPTEMTLNKLYRTLICEYLTLTKTNFAT